MDIETAIISGVLGLLGGAFSGFAAAKVRADADVKIAKTNAQQALDEIRELERVATEREKRDAASTAAKGLQEASGQLSEAGSALRRAWAESHPSQLLLGEARRQLAAAARLAQEAGRDDLAREAEAAEQAGSKSEAEAALARLGGLLGAAP